jgi:type III secretory pathway component EscU
MLLTVSAVSVVSCVAYFMLRSLSYIHALVCDKVTTVQKTTAPHSYKST